MARENQGLQITLIVFIILTLGLGVGTFFLYKQSGENWQKAQQFEKDLADARAAATKAIDAEKRMKDMVGFAETHDLSAAEADFVKDQETYGARVTGAQKSYRQMLAALASENRSLNTNLTAKTNEWKDAEKEAATAIAEKDRQVAVFRQTLDSATAEFNNEKANFAAARKALEDQLAELTTEKEKFMDDVRIALDDAGKRVTKAESEAARVGETNGLLQERLAQYSSTTFEKPDGLIDHITQDGNTVFINLGRDHGLQRGTTFSVYASNTNDITQDAPKATVEVNEITGAGTAQARVLEDEVLNPIMIGDLIHTPLWAPGQNLRFSLTDGMDIDGDGKSDVEYIKNLITMNDGSVDAWVDDTNEVGTIHGDLTINTRYLVVGANVTEDTPKEVIVARNQMISRAKNLGIPSMALPELLRRMGHKETASITTYGKWADPDQFKAKPVEGFQQKSPGHVSGIYMKEEQRIVTSPGNVSELFRKRNPPKHATGTAYE